MLRELLNPGGCLGTPSASPPPPAPACAAAAGTRPRDTALRDAVRQVGAADALEAADVPDYDGAIRESHAAGIGPVGIPGGTPTLHLDGAAFFGPILNAVPTRVEALEMFDGTRLLARNPQFSELKRARPEEISVR